MTSRLTQPRSSARVHPLRAPGSGVLVVNALLAIALMYRLRWKMGLVCAVVPFVASFHVVERLLKRNRRYQALDAVIPRARLKAQAPALVLELRSVADATGLRGGSVR